MPESKFTWVQTHKELVNYLKGQQKNQQELINLLKEAGVTGISDGKEIELSEIDPFTFFFYIYKYENKKSLAVLQKIASNLGLTYPEDLDGVPLTNGINVRFFPEQKDRNKNEINRLWDFFFKAIEYTITDADFLNILQIKGVGKPKLTQGLFMIDPENYLCIDAQTKPYLNYYWSIETDFTNYTEYNELLNEVRAKVNEPFYQISYVAWISSGYWIFKLDSTNFKIGENWKKDPIIICPVTYKANMIKKGDKVIIWLIGTNSGCYALGEIKEIKRKMVAPKIDDININTKSYVTIRITYNIIDNPILESQLYCLPELINLVNRLQETNAPVKKEYYDKLIDIISMTAYDLNTILYGPPGTGKTYNSINKAVEIIDPEFMKGKDNNEADRKEITKRYRELEEEGRIVFITFHQSLSYEDFVEGIKPVIKEDENNTLSYEIVPGIFKQLCDRASLHCESSLRNAYNKLKNDLAKNENLERKYKTPEDEEFGLSLWGDNITVHYGTELKLKTIVTRDKLTSFLLKKNEPSTLWTYYQGIINLLKKEYGFDDQNTSKDNYVLIIDEINRGNVSQIFGELITLIEKDKRAGNEEALSPTLPYSKTKFSVPANLYIIGTMNTADRSVEALDTALRRRFSFIEMTPDYSLLENTTATVNNVDINLGKLLEVLNQRIECLMDKDHKLGHSYFLQVAKGEFSLKHIFFNEIIPLLQEYFYGNDEKLQLILGKGFVKDEPANQDIYAKTKIDISDYNDRPRFYLIKDEDMDEPQFLDAIRILLTEKEIEANV